MEYQNTLFVEQELVSEKNLKSLVETCKKYAIFDISVVFPYDERAKPLPKSTDTLTFTKTILFTNSKHAQNYPKLKKEHITVLYQPDFSNEKVEEDIRKMCEKGWCDVIFGLEQSAKPDGLHKKRHSITQVEARLMCENNISFLVQQESLLTYTENFFALNRLNQMKHILQKQNVKSGTLSFVRKISEIRPLTKASILDKL